MAAVARSQIAKGDSESGFAGLEIVRCAVVDKTYIFEAIQWCFSILMRTSSIRSTCAHVTVAKVAGAATWPPHGPPWGVPARVGKQRSLV